MKIHISDSITEDKILLGNNETISYIYAPYVPLTVSPVVLEPDTFAPSRGFLTRYDKRLTVKGARTFGKIMV